MASVPLIPPCIEGNRGPVNVGIGALFLSICVILTSLRVFLRVRRIAAGFGWDDAFILIAMVLTVPLYAFTILHTKYGLGRHIGCLSLSDVVKADKIQAIGEVPIMMSTLFSRISICLFLLRLFAVNLTWRWVLYFIIALTAATNIACATAILLQCHPRAKMWNPALPGTCWSKVAEVAIGQVQGAVSVFLDLILSGLPIYCMWKIQMSWRIKAAICGLMSMGVFTASCALVRIIILGRISGVDITYDSALPSLMGDLEAYVSIIVANIPTLRPLFTQRSKKPPPKFNQFNDSEARLKYTKFSGNPYGLDQYSANSYNTEATAERVRDIDSSLEHEGGIRRVVDVKVSG